MAEAKTKRSFYNKGEAKGFTRERFFEEVAKMAAGTAVSEQTADLMAKAALYELEGIALKPKRAAGEGKNSLDSDYANLIRRDVVPAVDGTLRTANELINIATSKKKLGPKGKPYAAPWVSRVLNNEPGIIAEQTIVNVTNTKGLQSQREVTAYKRG